MSLTLDNIFQQPFVKAIHNRGGEVFAVGGCVRDKVLGLIPKDLDLLVTKIPYEDLRELLMEYATYTNMVGRSFGIIKFKPIGFEDVLDISIPRKDRKIEGAEGHKGIEAEVHEDIPLEYDLLRRDFTINSIALTAEGKFIDPFNGLQDIKDKIIRATSPMSFIDDPLRMARAIQFSARFKFEIDKITYGLIKTYAEKIKEISIERFHIEIAKVEGAGSLRQAFNMLSDTGIRAAMIGLQHTPSISFEIKDLIEFYYFYIDGTNKADFFKLNLKGDVDTYKRIKALEYLTSNLPFDYPLPLGELRYMFHEANKICDYKFSIPNFYLTLPKNIATEYEFFINNYPLEIKDLHINGADLLMLGLNGKAVGDTLNKIYRAVLWDALPNEHEALIGYTRELLQEA